MKMHHEGNLYIRTKEDAERYATLTSVSGNLWIDADANLPALTSVGGNLWIDADANLPALTTVGGELRIDADANLPALTSVGGYPLPSTEIAEANLRRIAPLALKDGALEMRNWHCGTSHCIAGWGQHEILGVRDDGTASVDGIRTLGLEAARHFYASNERARVFLEQYV